jgi:putative hydrolase of the HAD superfamily
MPKALLFDVGDVLMEHNWRLLELLSRKVGRDLGGRGPFAPETDPVWKRFLNHEISLDTYWDIVSETAGYGDRISLWRAMAQELGDDVFASDSLAFVDEAKAAGIPVGILTNDLVRSSGRPWVDSRPEFTKFDMLVDCTEFGERKPAPAPYLHAAALLGLAVEEIVFLDDMQYCITGAEAVGMVGVLVDPLNRTVAFDEARRLVGLRA